MKPKLEPEDPTSRKTPSVAIAHRQRRSPRHGSSGYPSQALSCQYVSAQTLGGLVGESAYASFRRFATHAGSCQGALAADGCLGIEPTPGPKTTRSLRSCVFVRFLRPKLAIKASGCFLEPSVGIEPTTFSLPWKCATDCAKRADRKIVAARSGRQRAICRLPSTSGNPCRTRDAFLPTI